MSEQVVPFYVMCDESYSMTDHMDTLNAGLRGLHHAITNDHRVASKIRFCLIGFSSTPNVLVPLSRMAEVTEITGLAAKAATNFGAAFTLLRHVIEEDVERLNNSAYTVNRPVVFFLSDGQPTDPASWRAAYDRLTDQNWPARPHIIAFGIGDADARTIRSVGTFKAFMSNSGVNPDAAVQEFAKVLTDCMVMSGRSATDGDFFPKIPESTPGFSVAYAGKGL